MLNSMRVLVVASQKGGSGKTTLSGHLAVQADRNGQGPVALIDTDPQGSLAQWWNERQDESPAFVQSSLQTLRDDLETLREQGFKLVVIDTPPAVTKAISQVVQYADLVVLPTRPSPHDLRAVGATVDILEAHGKALVFVLNGATVRARITGQAAVALSQHGTVAPVTVHHRVNFASSMIDGRTVMEIDEKCASAKEIVALWEYLDERLKRRHVVARPRETNEPAPTHNVVAIPNPIAPEGLRPTQPFGRRGRPEANAV
jgi:chromosome partitioning protein